MASIHVSSTKLDAMWDRMNQAVSSFCLNVALESREQDKMVCALVGEELEWCGAHSYLFMASRYVDATNRANIMEEKLETAEASYCTEAQNLAKLRKSLKQCQVAAEDNEWQFQEQLAHINNMLQIERQGADELKQQVKELQGKLVEVEMYLGSEKGSAVLRLEEELAETRLKLANFEEESDRRLLQQQSQKLKRSSERIPLSLINGQQSPVRMSKTKEMAMKGALSIKLNSMDDEKENVLSGEQIW